MNLTAVQWNIGGGKIRLPDADPMLIESYVEEGLGYCIERLQHYAPDIITLQESHADASRS